METNLQRDRVVQLVPKRVLDESRRLFARLQSSEDTSPIVIGLTSAIRGEGKTTFALGLALAIAQDIDENVWLLELDFEHPNLDTRLTELTLQSSKEQLWENGQLVMPPAFTVVGLMPNLLISPAEQIIVGHGEEVMPSRLIKHWLDTKLIDKMKNNARLIVLDLPPINASSYGSAGTALADKVVLVIRANITPIQEIKDAVAGVDSERLAGVVLNGTTTDIPRWLNQFF